MISSIFLLSFLRLFVPSDTSIHTQVELKALVSDDGTTPFWMRSLTYGTVPIQNPGVVGIVRHGKQYNLAKKYDWKYQVEGVGLGGKQNDFILSEAYVSGRRGRWELWAGRRKEMYGLGDSSLTGGFYIWSGNAIPLPKIQLGTRDYINFFYKWFGIHMTYSHGLFDNSGPVINTMLHQKTLYGRIGKPNSLFSFFGGINHNVKWGGEAKVKTGGERDYLPSSLNTYFYVVTVKKDRTVLPIDAISTSDDYGNQFGNHLGSIDFALKFQPQWGEFLVYKQTAYETGRIFSLVTADDGISGISFKRKKRGIIEAVTFEYLYTANQGLYISGLGRALGFQDPHKREIESYFNNGYGSWSYLRRAQGTPLIVPDSESPEGGGANFSRNAVQSYYLGIKGTLPNLMVWQLRISQSYHGYIVNHYPPLYNSYVSYIPQFSSALTLGKMLTEKMSFQAQIGYDQGERVKNTVGISFGLKYQIH